MRCCALLLVLAAFLAVNGQETAVDPSGTEGTTDPCSCALLNFWDIKPRDDATTCCEALQELCINNNNTLHCGHVYRFCLKRRAGFSAYILDEFVRTELRKIEDLQCDAFNPYATHENELCGGGYCRIGYQCAKVNAQKCFSDGGIVCGDGYCNNGAECAEMSTQVCKRFKKKNLEKKRLKNYDEPVCRKGVCEACKMVSEYKCAFNQQMRDPCKTKGCASGRRCETVQEEVCVVRPDAALYINGAETHDPEQVSQRFRRFTAVVLPAIATLVAVISVVAFISWATIRVRKARKEVGMEEESENGSPHAGDNEATTRETFEKELPLTPKRRRPSRARNAIGSLALSVADILSPRMRLSISQSPKFGDDQTPQAHPSKRGGRYHSAQRYSTLEGADSFSESEMSPKAGGYRANCK